MYASVFHNLILSAKLIKNTSLIFMQTSWKYLVIFVPRWVLNWFYSHSSFSPAVLASVRTIIIAPLASTIAKKLHLCLHFVQLSGPWERLQAPQPLLPTPMGLAACAQGHFCVRQWWHIWCMTKSLEKPCRCLNAFKEWVLHLSSSPCPQSLPVLHCRYVCASLCTSLILTLIYRFDFLAWPQICLLTMNLFGDTDSWMIPVIITRPALPAFRYWGTKPWWWGHCPASLGVVFIFQLASPFGAALSCWSLTQLSNL